MPDKASNKKVMSAAEYLLKRGWTVNGVASQAQKQAQWAELRGQREQAERLADQYMGLHNEAASELFDVRAALGVTADAVGAARAAVVAREQAEAWAKELEDVWGSRAGKMRAEVESHKQTADQIAKLMILAADERMQRAERALAEERAHADRLHSALTSAFVWLAKAAKGIEFYDDSDEVPALRRTIGDVFAEHAARRGG